MIGAIAGGPTGAAAGLALQGLLRDALGEAAEARYSIRGRWDEPEVTRIDVLSRVFYGARISLSLGLIVLGEASPPREQARST